jgi:Tol biopolymer transport system component
VSFRRLRHPSCSVIYVLLILVLSVMGCSSKKDPTETLDLCGNHSCGTLAMITTDTTSDGFQYLDATLSPDGQTILFSADWEAIPAAPRPPEDQVPPRQICIIPAVAHDRPIDGLTTLGGELIFMRSFTVWFGGSPANFDTRDAQKNDPTWVNDDFIICSIFLPRGNRLVLVQIGGDRYVGEGEIVTVDPTDAYPEIFFYEPQDLEQSGLRWQHFDPALSPDGEWLAFTRFGCENMVDPSTCTRQSIWAVQTSTFVPTDPDVDPPVLPIAARAIQLTAEVAEVVDPAWSPDGRKLCFGSSVDISGETGAPGLELYSIDFDPVAAAAGPVELNAGLRRITNTPREFGNPLDDVRNYGPSYTASGNEIIFVSTQRAPTVTIRDRNIWRVVADGSLVPSIVFFSREDDVDPSVDAASSSIVLCSRMGFPTSMLDQIEQETYDRIAEEDTTGLTETEIRDLAQEERRELEFFAGVMSHIFVFRDF